MGSHCSNFSSTVCKISLIALQDGQKYQCQNMMVFCSCNKIIRLSSFLEKLICNDFLPPSGRGIAMLSQIIPAQSPPFAPCTQFSRYLPLVFSGVEPFLKCFPQSHHVTALRPAPDDKRLELVKTIQNNSEGNQAIWPGQRIIISTRVLLVKNIVY